MQSGVTDSSLAPPVTAARSWGRSVLYLVVAVVALYGVALALLYWRQELLLFAPVRLPADHRFGIEGVVERAVPVEGATLSALHFRQSGAKGVVFFLHGNAGNLQEWVTGTEFYRRTGFDLFIIDYRGYGKSTGRITSEAQLHADVAAAWRYIAPEYSGRKVVLYGRSLGSGLATRLATEVPADLLVLVSPYSSLLDVARDHYPWVPSFVMRYPVRTDRLLAAVKMPVLLLHGDADHVIGIAHSERLKAIRPDATLARLPGVAHNDVHLSREYVETLAAAVGRL